MKTYCGIAISLLGLVRSGCAMYQDSQRLSSDPLFQSAAKSLVRDFLDGQKNGESQRTAEQKYGAWIGIGGFLELGRFSDYQIIGVGEGLRNTAILVQIQGSPTSSTEYGFFLQHDRKLEATGDKYMGWRISSIEADGVTL